MDQKEWDTGDESGCFLVPVLIFLWVCVERLRLKSDDNFPSSLNGLTIPRLSEKWSESIFMPVSDRFSSLLLGNPIISLYVNSGEQMLFWFAPSELSGFPHYLSLGITEISHICYNRMFQFIFQFMTNTSGQKYQCLCLENSPEMPADPR